MVANCATPLLFSVPTPNTTTPSINVTEPGAPAGTTCAVSVTLCPKMDAAGVVPVSVVVVITTLAGSTASDTGVE